MKQRLVSGGQNKSNMDIKIEGNPGTGNTFQEIHIGNVQNYNPNATTIITNNYGVPSGSQPESPSNADLSDIRQDVLDYVDKTSKLVEKKWQDGYMDLWQDILDLDMVAARVYDRGRQKGTRFNRSLVANILCYLGDFRRNGSGMFGAYSATSLVMELEGTTACSTRLELGSMPELAIRDAIHELLTQRGIA